MAKQNGVNISMFTYLFAIAIGMGTAITVGRLIGRNEKEEAYASVWSSVKWALLFTIRMVALVMIFRYPLLGLFTDNKDIIEMN